MSQKQATTVQASNGSNRAAQLSPKGRPTLPPIKAQLSTEGQIQGNQRAESQSPAAASSKDRPMGPLTSAEPRRFNMHSILNPAGVKDETTSRRSSLPPDSYPRRSTSESPASSNGPLTPGKSFPPINRAPSPHLTGVRLGIPSAVLANRGPGAVMINQPAAATIDAKKSPFLPNPTNGSYNLGDMAQSRLTPPLGSRPVYSFPQQNLIKSEDRRGSDASQMIPSQSNSPTTSLTSYGTGPGTGSRTSPVLQYSHCVTPSEHLKRMGGSNPYGVPGNGNGQGTYQLMTIDTDQGPVQFPVDVQAASKVADEKRKRNAGASARFRQRRKEKEREAAHTISRLESKVRELSDDKEFYRMERDYFRQLVYNSPAQSQVVPRPPSPKPRKPSVDTSSTGTPEWQQNGERGSDDGRNQRRRISGYYETGPEGSPPPPPAQGPPPTSHNPHAAYPTQQPAYGYMPDARPRPLPPAPHQRPHVEGQSPITGPPPLRAGYYEAGVPRGYEHPFYPPRA
ncbi:MAG: hypothetical protein LQ340_005046 [Diploschistes diacapsis]|nr:MAG: hypothetical protein LQ340_005046 [Diploschistes diacapsis]